MRTRSSKYTNIYLMLEKIQRVRRQESPFRKISATLCKLINVFTLSKHQANGTVIPRKPNGEFKDPA